MMSPSWDSRHEVPVYEYSSIEGSLVRPDGPSRNIVRAAGDPSNRLDVDALFIPNESRTLVVAFHGALVRKDVELPRFEWLGTLRNRSENLMFIADTTLSLSPDLTLGWYIGTAEDNLTDKISRYIRHVAELRKVTKVILIGSSGGGYAALSIATQVPNSCAIAFSPQTDVFEFTPGHTANLINYVFPEYKTVERLREEWPERFSLIERYKNASFVSRFIYYQNLGDIDHNTKHKKPFATSLGVRLPDGRTFNQAARFKSRHHGDGHVRPPTAELPKLIDEALEMLDEPIKTKLASAGLSGSLLDCAFREDGRNSFQRVRPEVNSYYSRYEAPLKVTAPNLAYTDDGVPLRVIDGEAYDHPVLQAQFLLKIINNYRLAPSSDLLSLMDAIVMRLRSQSVESHGATYLPYQFPWHQGALQPPWYSAMAQGQALGAVSRLYEVNPKAEYLEFADGLFRSFLNLRSGEEPWVVDIDRDGYLWFEEYPYHDHGMGVMNGHLFAVFGVYDYWRVTDNNLACRLANAALLTTKKYASSYRNPGWSSHYDLTEFLLIRNYHSTHVHQLETAYALTGDAYFTQLADEYESDFPSFQRGGSVYIAAGDQVLATTDHNVVPTGIIDRQVVQLDRAIAVPFSIRSKIETEPGIWLLLSEGEFAGSWIREEAIKVFPKGCFDRHSYPRPREGLLQKGTYTTNEFNEFGTPIRPEDTVLHSPRAANLVAKALWRGKWYYQLSGDSWDSRWIEADTEGLHVY